MEKLKNTFSRAKENVGFLGKHATSLIGAFFLLLAGVKINKENCEKRILIVFGGGVGDVAVGSVVCGYVKEYLEKYDVYYLMPYKFKLPYAKENIYFNYRKSKEDPFYYFSLINRLRSVGFSKVVVMFPFWEGFLASLASDIKPEQLFCYKEAEPNTFYRMTSKVNYFLKYFSMRKRLVLIKVASGWTENGSKTPKTKIGPAEPSRHRRQTGILHVEVIKDHT